MKWVSAPNVIKKKWPRSWAEIVAFPAMPINYISDGRATIQECNCRSCNWRWLRA